MDEKRLPKRLFYGDVVRGSRPQGGQVGRYKDTLGNSLKRLQINPTDWEDLARDRPIPRRTVKTDATIYEVSRIAAAKPKRETRKSQLRPPRNANVQSHRLAHAASGRSGHQSALQDIIPPGLHQLLSPCPTLPYPPRRQL
ncbi:hypothetical protein SprV_0100148500 [Sparganum proliferum]